MKAVARLRHLGVPSLKVRRFASTIKGEPVNKAVAILDLQSSPTCQALSKLLKSAIANAQNNLELDPKNLQVSNVLVDQGPSLKRIKPRARGRAFRILKRSCHVTIELDFKKGLAPITEEVVESKPAKSEKTTKAKAAKPAAKATEKKAKAETKKPVAKSAKPKAKAEKGEAKSMRPASTAKKASRGKE